MDKNSLEHLDTNCREICDRWFRITDATQTDFCVQGKILGLECEGTSGAKLFTSVSEIRGFNFKHIERDITGNWWVVNGGRRKRVLFEWI